MNQQRSFVSVVILLIISTSSVLVNPKPEDHIRLGQSAMMLRRWNMGKIKTLLLKKPQQYHRQNVLAAA